MTRMSKWLKATRRNPMPRFVAFLDTETYLFTDEKVTSYPLRLGCIIFCELDENLALVSTKTAFFNDFAAFLSLLTIWSDKHSKQALYIFGHNIGFDVRVLDLPSQFDQHDISSELPIISNRVFFWKVRLGDNTLNFLDTGNFGVQSVKKLGDDLRYPKLHIDFENCSEARLMAYCRRDCRIIQRFMLSYLQVLKTYELGGFKITLASQSLAAYRTHFMRQPLYIHCNQEALDIARKGYFGGRVECFRIGQQPDQKYYQLDVNSMYPFIMSKSLLPYKWIRNEYNISVKKLKTLSKYHYVVAHVQLNTDSPFYPYRDKKRLLFPVGDYHTVLQGDELALALELNHITAVYQIALYHQGLLFQEYALFWYERRQFYKQSGNTSWQLICKLFGNSLYGKMGQLLRESKFVWDKGNKDIYRKIGLTFGITTFKAELCWLGKLYFEYHGGETHFSLPEIAGGVTSNSRYYLLQFILAAGNENTFYTDTDSLIVNQQGYDNLQSFIDPQKLGMLKVEGVSDHLKIYNLKDYEFGEKTVHKGIPESAKHSGDNVWEVTQFQSFITWLNNYGKGGVKSQQMTKRRVSEYLKGTVDPDTGIVTPYQINSRP